MVAVLAPEVNVQPRVLIAVYWIAHAGDARGIRPFGLRPTEIGSGGDEIHLFPAVLTDVVDVDTTVGAIDPEVERIAQAAGDRSPG